VLNAKARILSGESIRDVRPIHGGVVVNAALDQLTKSLRAFGRNRTVPQ
jgi:hypothetical protein